VVLRVQGFDCTRETGDGVCMVQEKPSTASVIFNITATYDGPRLWFKGMAKKMGSQMTPHPSGYGSRIFSTYPV